MTKLNEKMGEIPSPPMAFDPVEAALREIFDGVASEDVPPDFAELIAKLAKQPRLQKA